MGSVKLETPNQNRGVHEYEKYTLSDEWCVKNLILNRINIDEGYRCKLFSNNNPFEASDIPNWRELITCIYHDLEVLISRCKLTNEENLIVNKLMMGYDFFDVEDLFLKQEYGVVENIFNSVVERIIEENEKNWKTWVKMNIL